MKIVFALAALSLGLAGCDSVHFWDDSDSGSSPAPQAQAAPASDNASAPGYQESEPSAPAPVAQATPSSSAHCSALAKQRAMDAAFQGEDGDTQESVYTRTYSDCVAWDIKHNL